MELLARAGVPPKVVHNLLFHNNPDLDELPDIEVVRNFMRNLRRKVCGHARPAACARLLCVCVHVVCVRVRYAVCVRARHVADRRSVPSYFLSVSRHTGQDQCRDGERGGSQRVC